MRHVEITKRSVSEYGKRRRYVYDAKLGDLVAEGHTSAASARAAILEDAAYVEHAPKLVGGNCLLKAYRHNSWEFHLRTQLCGGSCVCLFGAANVKDAYAKLYGYRDHPDAQVFFEIFDCALTAIS